MAGWWAVQTASRVSGWTRIVSRAGMFTVHLSDLTLTLQSSAPNTVSIYSEPRSPWSLGLPQARYDPNNFFKQNHNILPAAAPCNENGVSAAP